MKVLIDGDGCPVVDITVSLSRKYAIACILLCDTAHIFNLSGVQTLIFDKGSDSVDMALVNRISPGDLVITQDYGLASLCLSRKAVVLHHDGWEYTPDNIDALLFKRHVSRKLLASGKRIKGPKKRIPAQNLAFQHALEQILQSSIQG